MDKLTSESVHENDAVLGIDSSKLLIITVVCCRQALAECGLKPVQDEPSNTLKTNSVYKQDDVTLVCKKLLSAKCVRQQIEAMQEHQLHHTQSAAAATAPQCSKQRTESDSEDAMHTDRCAEFNATAGCSNTEESSQGCLADVVEPAVASPTNSEASGAAADTSPRLRYNYSMILPHMQRSTPCIHGMMGRVSHCRRHIN